MSHGFDFSAKIFLGNVNRAESKITRIARNKTDGNGFSDFCPLYFSFSLNPKTPVFETPVFETPVFEMSFLGISFF